MYSLCRFSLTALLLALLFFALNAQAELKPLLVPNLDVVSNKFIGKSVIADSIDNQSLNQQFRDRTYYYDLALDSTGKAYVLYANPKPVAPNSSLPIDFETERTDIILATETTSGWDKITLSTDGVYQPAGLQIEADSNDVLHIIYIRKTAKLMGGVPALVDYLMYRKLQDGLLSEEIEVGNLETNPANFAGLGGWRTRMAIAPDNSVYMLREGGVEGLLQPLLNLLSPDGEGNWTMQPISGLPTANWYRLAKFLIDKAGQPHIIYADYAYNNAGQVYTSGGFAGLEHFGFHNLWYATAATLTGQGWNATQLDEDPASSLPTLYNFQFWPDLALDENNHPSVANWLWKAGTVLPGYGASTVFFQRDGAGNWTTNRATRTFDNAGLSYIPNGSLAGMGPGLVKNSDGWHGVWDSSHPRPFEHSFGRGGILYRYSPDGKDWSYYQPLAEFSAEGYCLTEIDSQHRLNVLVLGDHTDTQLYLLRYQLPDSNLMEVFSDRRYYYNGEPVTLHARIQSGAVGDFYVATISDARPEINQPSEIWQLTSTLAWQKITDLSQLKPLLSLPVGAGLNFNAAISTIAAKQVPFDKPDTDYTLYSLVTRPNTDITAGEWITPLYAKSITVNKSLPQ